VAKKYNMIGHSLTREIAFNDMLKDEFTSTEYMNVLRHSVDRQMLFIPKISVCELKEVENALKIIPLNARVYKNGNNELSKHKNECIMLNQDYRKSITMTIIDYNDNIWTRCISKKAFSYYKEKGIVFKEMTDVEFWCKKEEFMPITFHYCGDVKLEKDELLQREIYIIKNFINEESNANRN